ncbi:MAG: ribbon-helix-helix protein, CopG family [Solirubrobacterales bacterium]
MSKLLSVSLPDDLSDRTDEIAELQGRTRSEVVRDALRSYLWRERWAAAARFGRAAAEERGIGPEDVERIVDEARASG